MLGNYGTLAVNINDFTRYARDKRTTYIQLFIIPASFVLMALMGIIIAGAAEEVYDELIWDPLTIMGRWTGTRRARAGAAFCGLALGFAQAGTNLGANCISGASDLNALFPKVSLLLGVPSIAVLI
jgi:NCS1 family nucleobase:cation symporter-1